VALRKVVLFRKLFRLGFMIFSSSDVSGCAFSVSLLIDFCEFRFIVRHLLFSPMLDFSSYLLVQF
jgi:hypothetical protein